MGRLFFDLDGTVAQFYRSADCLERMYERGYFRGLAEYPNVSEAIRRIIDDGNIEVYSLSACIDSPYCFDEKQAWLDRHFPALPTANRIFVPVGSDKSALVPEGIQPADVLLDDYNRNLEQWKAAGGRSVKCVNEINHKGRIGTLWTGRLIRYNSLPAEIQCRLLNAVYEAEHKHEYGSELEF